MNHIKKISRQSSGYLLETKKPSKMGVKPPHQRWDIFTKQGGWEGVCKMKFQKMKLMMM